jgi:hypothetical protein
VKNSILHPGLEEVIVVFAHPDDEILYFYQYLKFLKPKRLRLVCATEIFTREKETVRLDELKTAAEYLGGELINLGLEDRLQQPLDVDMLSLKLKTLGHRKGVPVLTHGAFGEYGHCHHMDVFLAVLGCFDSDVWCISGPLQPSIVCTLTDKELAAKRSLLKTLYPSQKVQAYVGGEECFTHVNECIFSNVLLAASKRGGVNSEQVAVFLQHGESAYFDEHNLMPIEAQAAATQMGAAEVQRRIRERINDWKIWLNQLVVEN